MKIKKLLVSGGFALLLALAWYGNAAPVSGKTLDEVALVVDQDSMTRGELEEAVLTFFMSQQQKPPQLGTPAFEKARLAVVEGFIREVLLAEEADRLGIAISEGEMDREVDHEIDNMKKGFPTEKDFNEELLREGLLLDDLKQDTRAKLQRRMKASRALRAKQQELPGMAPVSEDEVRAHFNENPLDYDRVKFAVILFRVPAGSKPAYAKEVEKQAQGVLVELKKGANFAAYAKKYSEESGTADKGGQMGTFFRSELAPKMAKGIFAIPEKSLGLVKAPEGVYIVRVDQILKADYATVGPEIKTALQRNRQDSGFQKWIDGVKKNAYIMLDGKVYSNASPEDQAGAPGSTTEKKPNSTVDSKQAAAPKGDTAPTPVAGEKSTAVESGSYPTLPAVGSWTFTVAGEGFYNGTDDLAKYFGTGVATQQDLPLGFGLTSGVEFSLDHSIQIGAQIEYLRKFTETVTDQSSQKFQWNAGVLAPSLTVRLLIPLDEGTNFVLSVAGGYYFISSGGFNAVNSLGTLTTVTEFSASNFGGKAGGGLEFFLDEKKGTAFGFSVDYRYLVFNPITTRTTQDGLGLAPASPLLNAASAETAKVDFSGVNVGVNLRFYLGKS